MTTSEMAPITELQLGNRLGQPVVEIDGVSFSYVQGQTVLEGVSASLVSGRVTALLGPNAAGKSTLVKVMLGQLHPDAGMVRLHGEDVSSLKEKEMARGVSYVPQQSGNRFSFTVRQMVAMGRFAFGDERSVDAALQRCGLLDLATRSYAELSGGQQQRVMIARAWAQSRGSEGRLSSVILADEPASSLDLRHAHEAMAMLRGMAEEGLAVLVVLHGLELASRWADEVWLMDRGRLVGCGDAAQMLTPERLGPVYGVSLDRVEAGGRSHLYVVGP